MVVTHILTVVENQEGATVFENASVATCMGSDTSDVF